MRAFSLHPTRATPSFRPLTRPAREAAFAVPSAEGLCKFVDCLLANPQAICVLDPEEAQQRDAMMMAAMADPTLAPPPPPPPTLGDGVWRSGDRHAGQLSHQGIVTYGGRTGRFDDVVGTGWTLIGRGHDPSGSLSESTRAVFADLGGRCVNVDAHGADAADVEGTYAGWFDQMGVDTVLIRPDGYVAAAVAGDEADSAIDEMVRLLEPSLASPDPRTDGAAPGTARGRVRPVRRTWR